MRFAIVSVLIALCVCSAQAKEVARAAAPRAQPHYRLGKAPKPEFKVGAKSYKIDPEAPSTKQVRALPPEHFDPVTRQQRVETFYRTALKERYEESRRLPGHYGPFRGEFVNWTERWPAALRARWGWHHRAYLDDALWARWMADPAFAAEIGALQRQNVAAVVGYLPPEYATTSPVLIYNDEYLNAAYNPVPFLAVLALKSLKPDEKTDWIGTAAAESLVTKLSSIPGLFLAEREQVMDVLRDQKLQEPDVVAGAQPAAQVGKALDVERVVVGSYVVDGDKVLFNLRIVDVQTGAVQAGVSQTVSREHLLDAMPDLASSLATALGCQPQDESPATQLASVVVPRPAVPSSPEASAATSRAGNIFDDDWVPPKRVQQPAAAPVPGELSTPTPIPPAIQMTGSPPSAAVPALPIAFPAPPSRLAIPDKAALATSRGLLKEVYSEQLKDQSVPGRRRLAQILLDEGNKPNASASDRFTLFDGAIQAAKEGVSLRLCFQVADTMASGFDVDALSIKTDSALKTNLRADAPASATEDVQPGIDLIDALVAAGDFADATHLATALRPMAAGDPSLRSLLQQHTQTIDQLQAAQARVGPFLERLKQSPADAAANFEVGAYYCFKFGNWERGLGFLARGSDPGIRDLATLELSKPTKTEDLVRLGNGWWDLGSKETNITHDQVTRHAATIYSQVLEATTGLLRNLLQMRIALVQDSQKVDAPHASGGPGSFRLDDLPKYERLGVSRTWARIHPKTTLPAQRVEGSLVLTRQNSPYLVTGLLLVPPGATLTIEPGAVVLFEPGVGLQNQGILNAVSDGNWIVLGNSHEDARWKGIDSTKGRAQLCRCIVLGADTGVLAHENREGLVASRCIFAENDTAVSVDSGSIAKVEQSLFMRNGTGLIGHGEGGQVQFSQCLLLFNKCGCAGHYIGKCEGTGSTFYGNDVAIEAADRGKSVRVSQSNVISTTGKPLGSQGGKVVADGDYWGKDGPPSDPRHECGSPLQVAVTDAMPNLPPCEYLSLTAIPIPVPSVTTTAAVQDTPGSVAPAPPNAPIPDSGAVAFLGTWEKSTLRGWQEFTIEPDGRATAATGQVGSWSVKDQKLFIAWPDENQVYDVPVGGTMTGKSISSQGTRNPLRSRRISNPGDRH